MQQGFGVELPAWLTSLLQTTQACQAGPPPKPSVVSQLKSLLQDPQTHWIDTPSMLYL